MRPLRILLFAFSAFGSQANAPKRDSAARERRQAPAVQRGSDTLPVAVKLLNTGKSEREAAEEASRVKAELDDAKATLQWVKITGAATGVLALFTLGLWLATWRLASDARGSSERQLRAYISIVPEIATQDEPSDDEMFLEFKATVTNSGQTPAYHLHSKAETKVLPATFPLNAKVNLQPSVGLLAPGADVNLGTGKECHIDATHAPVLKRSTEERLYFYGVVTYEDAFRKQWRQRFCYFADWDAVTDGLSLTVAAAWNAETSIGGQPPPKEGGQEVQSRSAHIQEAGT